VKKTSIMYSIHIKNFRNRFLSLVDKSIIYISPKKVHSNSQSAAWVVLNLINAKAPPIFFLHKNIKTFIKYKPVLLMIEV
jgi:hypothetical protein